MIQIGTCIYITYVNEQTKKPMYFHNGTVIQLFDYYFRQNIYLICWAKGNHDIQ